MTPRITFPETNKGFMDGLLKTESYLKRSGLDHQLMELVKFRVSQINCCAFCLDMHHKEAILLGESDLRLHSLPAWRETPYYNAQERAALAFAEALTLEGSQDVSDEVYEALADQFSKTEIADLTLLISNTNSWNRINKTFRTLPGNYQPGQFNVLIK